MIKFVFNLVMDKSMILADLGLSLSDYELLRGYYWSYLFRLGIEGDIPNMRLPMLHFIRRGEIDFED